MERIILVSSTEAVSYLLISSGFIVPSIPFSLRKFFTSASVIFKSGFKFVPNNYYIYGKKKNILLKCIFRSIFSVYLEH